MEFVKNYDDRSPVIALNGICASSQPLASQVGIDILKSGGNAVDAAIGMAATLNLTEPSSTGLGGDCLIMFWDNKIKQLKIVNGIGRSPMNLSIDKIDQDNTFDGHVHYRSIHSVTVPGAAAAWCDAVENFGSGNLSLEQIFKPSIDYCEQGIPIQLKTTGYWKHSKRLRGDSIFNNDFQFGDILKNQDLANTLKLIAKYGKDGFYKGQVADSIIDSIAENGGLMTHSDLENHKSTFDTPISTNYRGYQIYQTPPNGQGITCLMALNILEGFDMSKLDPLSVQHTHLVIEALRLSFEDSRYYVSDPLFTNIPVKGMLSKEYAAQRRSLINEHYANQNIEKGYPDNISNTTYLSVADKDGNVCSLYNSIYYEFGIGIAPKGCGFLLQNRGNSFSLDPNHPNRLEPGKRPYHTTMPTMIFDQNSELFASIGVVGGYSQPVVQTQIIINLIDHKMDPQSAISFPRFKINYLTYFGQKGKIDYETKFKEIFESLKERNHQVGTESTGHKRASIGNGQILLFKKTNQNQRIIIAGTDNRCDGMAIPY